MSTGFIEDQYSSDEWNQKYADLEKCFKETFYCIDKAIKLDEEGNTTNALPLYKKSLDIIDKVLAVPLAEPHRPNLLWEKALVMTQKLKKSRKELIFRIEKIQPHNEKPVSELPPSYEDAVGTSNGNDFQLPGPSNANEGLYISPSAMQDPELLANFNLKATENSNSPSFFDLSQQLKEMKLAKNEEILFHCDNVQMHFIAPDGRVSSTGKQSLIVARVYDRTSSLLDKTLFNIVTDLSRETNKKKHKPKKLNRRKHHNKTKKSYYKKDETLNNVKRTFLQVGSFLYPLIPEVSPILRADSGAFIIPDTNSNIKGAAIGLILPKESEEEFHELLTLLLNDVSSGERSRRSTDTNSSRTLSRIVRGATYVAHNLVRGAGTTARFLDSSTPKIISKIDPNTKPAEINPTVRKTIEVAKSFSGKALNVTDYLATKIGTATSALGRYLSPYIQKQGTKLLVSTSNMSEDEAAQKVNAVLSVASDTVESITTVYSGLETAATILARSLSNNTVQIIEYKYGQPAGALTNDALETVGNVYHTQYNIRAFKPKGFAKAALRGAGGAILEDYRNAAYNQKPHEEFPGSGPGSGSGFC